MGDQFWWFYDVLAVAAVLVCMFISGRKGAMKAVTTFVAYLISGVIALSLGASVGPAVAGTAMKESNSTKIEKAMGNNFKFQDKVADYINKMDYNIQVDSGSLAKIYNGKLDYNTQIYKLLNSKTARKVPDDLDTFSKKLNEGYAEIIRTIVAEDLNKYASEVAAKEVREHPQRMNELIPKLMEKESKKDAADFISENYVQPAYDTIAALGTFIVVFALLMLITLYFAKTLMGDSYHEMHLPEQIGAASIGILKGGVITFAIAVLVRLSVVLGSNEMLFFNHKAIDKTYIFKYLYNYIADHM